MVLPQRMRVFSPSNFTSSTAAQLGTQQKFAIDRTFPVEMILLVFNVTFGSTGPTWTGVDKLLGIAKKINLSINDGVAPRTVYDMTGAGCLEYAAHAGLNLDTATWDCVRQCQLAAGANNQKVRLTYPIYLVEPMLTEPLRTRTLQPFHIYPQDPVLTVDFETGANMYSAGSISALSVDVVVINREMSRQFTDALLSDGGFVRSDLIETPYTVATGISGELRFPVVTPGQYANLFFRSYLGGASITRDVLDQTTTFGAETLWRLESNLSVIRQWRWKHLQALNQCSQVANGLSIPNFAAATSAGSPTVSFDPSPNFAGAVAAGTSYQPASSVMLDFLSDGLDSASEFGSLLDCNLPVQTGVKMEVIGSVASTATNGSTLWIGGRRYFDDLLRWQPARRNALA